MKTLPEAFPRKQWVCTACGYNMIGEWPDVCPFCRARHDRFVTWKKGEAAYRVTPKSVTAQVTQLLSVPRLGLEHSAHNPPFEEPERFNRELIDEVLPLAVAERPDCAGAD